MTGLLVGVLLVLGPGEAASHGEIVVTSLPGGAIVWVDGSARGVTRAGAPLRLRLAAGDRRIRLSRVGYADLRATVRVRENATLPVKGCLVPYWDHARPKSEPPGIATGQCIRGQFRVPGKAPAPARIKVLERPKTKLLLKWSTPRLAGRVRILGTGDAVLSDTGKERSGFVPFTVPDDGTAVIEITCRVKDDPSWLGLGRYCITLARDACPLDATGKRGAPIRSP